MNEGRSLRAVFSELLGDDVARQAYAADPDGALGEAGHGELQDDLVAEAIVSFADTAPPGVAEHLAPFVRAHSVVPEADDAPPAAVTGLDRLASAPVESLDDPDVDTFGAPPGSPAVGDDVQPDVAPSLDDLHFGGGAGGTPPQPEITDALPDAVPFVGGGAADVPVDSLPEPSVPPGVPAPEPDEAETGDEDLHE